MILKPTVMQIRGVDGALYTLTDDNFDGPGIYLQSGAKGLDAPSYDTKSDEYPAIDGGFFRFARASVREIFLPIKIVGDTRPEMMALKRRFIASLNPKRGLVTLQSTEYRERKGMWLAETPRVISCYYVSGMEGGEGTDGNYHWATYGLVLRAPDPFFRHPSRSIRSFLTIEVSRSFFGPEGSNFLSLDGQTPGQGLRLSTSLVWVPDLDLYNPGDELSQPRWIIQGPLNSRMSMVRRDEDGNVLEELRFSQAVTLTPEQVIVIETTKGQQFARKYPVQPAGTEYDPTEGESVWYSIDVSSPMWAIHPGWNHIGLVIDKPDGMTPEEEALWQASNRPAVTVSYYPTFLGV